MPSSSASSDGRRSIRGASPGSSASSAHADAAADDDDGEDDGRDGGPATVPVGDRVDPAPADPSPEPVEETGRGASFNRGGGETTTMPETIKALELVYPSKLVYRVAFLPVVR